MSVFVYLEGTAGWLVRPEQAPEAVSLDIQVFPGILLPDEQLAPAVETQQAPIVTSGIEAAGHEFIFVDLDVLLFFLTLELDSGILDFKLAKFRPLPEPDPALTNQGIPIGILVYPLISGIVDIDDYEVGLVLAFGLPEYASQ